MRKELCERGVQIAKITQPGTSIASIAIACHDPDSVVCATALLELKKLGLSQGGVFQLLGFQVLPGPTKRALENRKEEWFLQTVVAMIHPDPDVLMELFRAGDWNVRLALANRQDCPEDILALLATLPVEASGHLHDRFDVIRNIAIKRRGLIEKPPDDEF